jgi:hypothetical protein
VALAYLVLGFGILTNRVRLKNFLFWPIVIFWIVGFISTLWAANTVGLSDNWAVFKPHLIFLHYFRRIEYLGVLFLAYAALVSGAQLRRICSALVVGLGGVIFYGLGQKYLGFCSYLTMNEEFAKGQCIALQPGTRISATFGGHYDLAGYLVFVLPIILALIPVVRTPFKKIALGVTAVFGFFILILTSSRISFPALFVGLGVLGLLSIKKKKVFVFAFLGILLFTFIVGRSTIIDRFSKTVRLQKVTINADTGRTLEQPTRTKDWGGLPESDRAIILPFQTGEATASAFFVQKLEKGSVPESTEPGVIRHVFDIPSTDTQEKSDGSAHEIIEEVRTIQGNFVRKYALVLDISFTTRFDGEWPKVIDAFLKHPILGQGYSTVTAAVDSSYLRALGEAGILGFLSFFAILVLFLVRAFRFISRSENVFHRMFVSGVAAGVIGLMINGLLIDIFEASKVAFVMWIVVGVAVWVIEEKSYV